MLGYLRQRFHQANVANCEWLDDCAVEWFQIDIVLQVFDAKRFVQHSQERRFVRNWLGAVGAQVRFALYPFLEDCTGDRDMVRLIVQAMIVSR